MANLLQIYPEVIIHRMDGTTFNASDFVQSIQIKKSVNQPVATMNITFNPAREGKLNDNITHPKIISYLKRNIKVQDVISVKIDDKSEKHSFLGFVDSPSENVSAFNTSTSYSYSINCSLLLPKLLLRDSIANAPALSTDATVVKQLGNDRVQFFTWMRGLTKDGKSPFIGLPEEAVKWILEKAPAMNVNLGNNITPKSFASEAKGRIEGTLQSLINFQFIEGELLFSPFLSTFTGPILNYIYACLDEFFYEVFFDTTTRNGLAYNTMVIRPKPFSFKEYYNASRYIGNWLYTEDMYKDAIRVNSSMRLQQELAKSDYDLKNFFWINFENSLIANASLNLGIFGVQFPIINLKSIKKYGLRELNATSTTINLNEVISQYNERIKSEEIVTLDHLVAKQENRMLNYLLDKREKLVEWHAFPFYESGRIVFPYNSGFELGKYLFYEDYTYYDIEKDKEYLGTYFYIHTVEESFSYGSQPKTVLGVNRGAPAGLVSDWLNDNRPEFVSRDTFEGDKYEKKTGSNVQLKILEDVKKIYEDISIIRPF